MTHTLLLVPAEQTRKAEPGEAGTPANGEWVWLASREDWDVGPFEVIDQRTSLEGGAFRPHVETITRKELAAALDHELYDSSWVGGRELSVNVFMYVEGQRKDGSRGSAEMSTIKTRDYREVLAELVRHGLDEREAEQVICAVDDSGYWEDPDRNLYVHKNFDPYKGHYEVGGSVTPQR